MKKRLDMETRLDKARAKGDDLRSRISILKVKHAAITAKQRAKIKALEHENAELKAALKAARQRPSRKDARTAKL